MSEKLTTQEHDPSGETESEMLAKKLAELIDHVTGGRDWSGDEPYEIQAIDTKTQKGEMFAIRRGVDWITIQRRESDNPSIIRTYSLEKEGESWEYIDPAKIKYDESSLSELHDVYEKIQMIGELSEPKKLSS